MSSTVPFIGRSPALRRVLALAARVAPTTHSVLVTGETGTGKEVLARYLHERSGRSGPFIAVNCAALPHDLAESELFGYERGAFTGAVGASPGLLREAHGGTLFLDELGEMPLPVQAKLLRVLQEGRVRPVGGRRELPVDVRIVAATLRDLRAEVAAGRFRADLLFRISTFELSLPPLRERGEDVVLLAETFVDAFAAEPGVGRRLLGRTAPAALRAYPWPGNVRELRTALLRAALHADGVSISGAAIRAALGVSAATAPLLERLLDRLQDGPATMAELTAATGVSRTTVWRTLAPRISDGTVLADGLGRRRTWRLPAATPATPEVELCALADADGRLTRQQVISALGTSERTATRLLGELVAQGRLRRVGAGRGSMYVLAG